MIDVSPCHICGTAGSSRGTVLLIIFDSLPPNSGGLNVIHYKTISKVVHFVRGEVLWLSGI